MTLLVIANGEGPDGIGAGSWNYQTIGAPVRRPTRNRAGYMLNGGQYIEFPLGAEKTFVAGKFCLMAYGPFEQTFCRLMSGASPAVFINTGGADANGSKLALGKRGATDAASIFLATSAGNLTDNKTGNYAGSLYRYYFEVKMAVDGFFRLWLNDALVLGYVGDTLSPGITGITSVYFRQPKNASTWAEATFSEILIADEPISDYEFVGTLVPNAVGDVNQWTGAYTAIDEIVPTTDYLTTAVAGAEYLFNQTPIDAAFSEEILNRLVVRSLVRPGADLPKFQQKIKAIGLKYWRLRWLAGQGSGNKGIGDIKYRKNGVDVPFLGVGSGSATVGTGATIAGAFDGNPNTHFTTATAVPDAHITFNFDNNLLFFDEVLVTASTISTKAAPVEFVIEVSGDGTNFRQVAHLFTPATWVDYETRAFAIPPLVGAGVPDAAGAVHTPAQGSFVTVTDEFALNPLTGQAWTAQDLANLQLGAIALAP